VLVVLQIDTDTSECDDRKGQKNDIENYRPIANLCATSKIFEKLVLKRILEIQDNEGTDLTGDQQHGFKRKRSTSTLSSKLLSEISRALDDDDYVLTTSIDLSSAFDLVNVDLLIKRLIKIGLPEDLIELIESWLKNRSYYVSIDGEDSILYDLLLGTVQGSILGPVLYSIFVSPLFKIADLELFADDSFITKSNESLTELIKDMEKSLEAITKWLKQ
jgi:predicted house-cleaning noncanonical NTP pyrophosphatase (MazG superfamily)